MLDPYAGITRIRLRVETVRTRSGGRRIATAGFLSAGLRQLPVGTQVSIALAARKHGVYGQSAQSGVIAVQSTGRALQTAILHQRRTPQ